jgi:hypothetical protein
MAMERCLFPINRAVFAAGAVLLMSVTGANAETWCRCDFGRDDPVCVFPNVRDCLSAAVIVGGVCEREKLANGAVKSCDPSRARSAKALRPDRAIACAAS